MKNPDSIVQETTSVYFNTIIRRGAAPKTAAEIESSVMAEFNRQVRDAFGDEGDVFVRRLR